MLNFNFNLCQRMGMNVETRVYDDHNFKKNLNDLSFNLRSSLEFQSEE